MASAPFSSGIDRSISTTSGCSSRACCTASRPSPASGDHLHVGLRLDQVLQALGDHAVVVGDEDADRHALRLAGTATRTTVPAPRADCTSKLPADGFGALAHRGHAPAPARRRGRVEALAVVGHREHQVLRRRPRSRCCTLRARACLSTLLSASCAMRNSATAASGAAPGRRLRPPRRRPRRRCRCGARNPPRTSRAPRPGRTRRAAAGAARPSRSRSTAACASTSASESIEPRAQLGRRAAACRA